MGNNLKINLEGKYVVLDSKIFKGTVPKRVFLCKGGFGCSPSTIGKAVFGKFVSDGEKSRVEGYHISRLATDKEIRQAKDIFDNKK
jgi:hypothetical protein